MNVKKSNTATLRKFFIFIFLFVSLLTISACSSSNHKVNGDLSKDKTFLQIGDYKISELDLYSELRPQGSYELRTIFDETLFATQLQELTLETIRTNDEYREYIESQINTALFNTTSFESIKDLSEYNRAKSLLAFADSVVITDSSINKTQLINHFNTKLDALKDKDVPKTNEPVDFDYLTGNDDLINKLIKTYKLNLAKRVYAKIQLAIDVEDINHASYIAEKDLVSYYNSNLKGKDDQVKALFIPFLSTTENQQARYFFQVKSNQSTGKWYQLPDVLTEDGYNLLKAGAEGQYSYAKDIFENKLSYTIPDTYAEYKDNVNYASDKYASFYSNYSLSTTRNDKELNNNGELNEDNKVLLLFLAIDSFLNENTKFIKSIDEDNFGHTVDDIEVESSTMNETTLLDYFTYDQDDEAFTANSSLLAELLKVSRALNEEDSSQLPYSKSPQSLGSNSYLIYVLEGLDTEKIVNDDNDAFLTDESLQARINEVKEAATKALLKSRLTTTYVDNAVTSLYEAKETKINIYDSIVRAFYEQSYSYNGSTKSKGKYLVATIEAKDVPLREIKVSELYEKLSSSYGLSTALDYLNREKLANLKDSDGEFLYQVLDDRRKVLKETFETTLSNFKANQFESSGFPSSIGLNKFLLLAFQAESAQEAFEKNYISSEIMTLYTKDYENHYGAGTATSNIYTKWAQLAAKQEEAYVGFDVSHLLVYVDKNLDGTPDDPRDLESDEQDAIEAAITQLLSLIERISDHNASINATFLTNLATQINNATRFGHKYSGHPLFADPDYGDDAKKLFTELRRLGVTVKFEALSTITNTTDAPTPKFVPEFSNYISNVINLFAAAELDKSEYPFFVPTMTLDEVNFENVPANIDFDLSDTVSEFGWHLILLNSQVEKASAKESSSTVSDYENPFIDGSKLDAKNDNNALTAEQIMIHLFESNDELGVETLSTTVKSAITSYFTPVKTLYDNQYHQLHLTFNNLFDDKFDFVKLPTLADTTLNTQLRNLYDSNLNNLFSYAIFPNASAGSLQEILHNDNYAALYGDFFKILNGTN